MRWKLDTDGKSTFTYQTLRNDEKLYAMTKDDNPVQTVRTDYYSGKFDAYDSSKYKITTSKNETIETGETTYEGCLKA